MYKPVTPGIDPVHDYLHYEGQPLDAIFAPKSVAVIGATENPGSVGRTLLWKLVSSTFGGTVYPVNPKRASILGMTRDPSTRDVAEGGGLVLVVRPATTTRAIIRD